MTETSNEIVAAYIARRIARYLQRYVGPIKPEQREALAKSFTVPVLAYLDRTEPEGDR